jgi:hypothetical protein
MRLPTNRQLSRLPRSFPVGAVYVVEGRGGQYGHLRVSSRYVLMPGGQRVEISAKLGRPRRAGALPRRQLGSVPRTHHRAEGRSGTRGKKFALGGGTSSEE